MDLYMNPSDIAEVIGVEAEIIERTLAKKAPAIEPFLQVVSAPPEKAGGAPKAVLQLRIDGLAPLITQLAYNIPTADIIDNLCCQIVHIAHLNETCENLENDIKKHTEKNTQLRETIDSLHAEKAELLTQIANLTEELKQEKAKTWVSHLFKR